LSPDNGTFVLIAIMLIPPNHVGIITIPNNTRQSQTAQLAHVIDTLLGFQLGDPLPQALIEGGFTSILDVVNLQSEQIAGLCWTNANNQSVLVPLAHRQKLHIAVSMYHHWSMEVNRSITMAEYDEYRISGYQPGAPLIPPDRNNNQNGLNGNPPPQNPPPATAGIARPQATPAEMFDRGIKKDKEHYPEFKEEKNWDSFRSSVEVTVDTHGTSDIIDTTYAPPHLKRVFSRVGQNFPNWANVRQNFHNLFS
jgi:hypothetical protein